MGKRELVIALAFIVVGVVAYELTAPPPKEGERGFSISRIFSHLRDEVSSNNASARVTKTGTFALRPGVTEIRLTAWRAVPIAVIGEKRADIGYEFLIESNGPDEARARQWAERGRLVGKDMGHAERFDIDFPQEGSQHGRLQLRIPAELSVHFEGGGQVSAKGVNGVNLRNLTGEITIEHVSGEVRGSHRAGEVQISHAGGVDLSFISSRARLVMVTGRVKVNARNAECSVAGSKGPLEAVSSNSELTITEHEGDIQVSGEGGTLRIVVPMQQVMVDVRRMLVETTMGQPVGATIITTDEPLRLAFTAPPKVTLDAVIADSGEIKAADFGLTPTRENREARLSQTIGAGGPRVLLRNTRGDIVIGLRK